MSLLLALLFLALFVSAVVRGQFSYGKADLSAATEKYLLSLGLEKSEIEMLKKRLK